MLATLESVMHVFQERIFEPSSLSPTLTPPFLANACRSFWTIGNFAINNKALTAGILGIGGAALMGPAKVDQMPGDGNRGGTLKNSQGGDVLAKSGIELIAMNDTKSLQPLVLGDNLQLALIIILDNLEALAKITHGYIKYQMKFNQALQQHTHNSPFYGISTLASEPAIIAGIKCDIETGANTELSILKHITNLIL